ncbi:MAG: DUF4179 domain-containing protein [Sarcina sp.]
MKKKFDFLNDTKNDLEKIDNAVAEEKEMSEEEKDEIRKRVMGKLNKEKNVKNNKKKKVAIAAGLSCVVIGGVALTNDSVMAGVQILGHTIEEAFGGNKNVIGFKSELNKVSSDKGITLSLKEAIIDNGVIDITGNIDYSQYNFGRMGADEVSEVQGIPTVDLEDIEVYSSEGETIAVRGYSMAYNYNEGQETGKVDFQMRINLSETFEKGYKINIPFTRMDIGYCDDNFKDRIKIVRGDWAFSFELDNSKALENTKIIDLNKKFTSEYEGEKFEFEAKSLVITPVSYTFNYSIDREGFSFNEKRITKDSYNVDEFEFEFYDQNNKKIDFFVDGGTVKHFETKYVKEEDRKITKIKVVPVMKNFMEEKVVKRFEENSFEINLVNK